MAEPALGMIELTSLARGFVAADVMCKKAQVRLAASHPVCPGKYLVLIAGEVGEVKEAMEDGVYYAGHTMVDKLVIENLHEQILPAISGTTNVDTMKAVGIFETFSVVTCVFAADAACKAADITLLELRLANGIGGKAFMTFTGELHSVEAAMEAAKKSADSGLVLQTEIIPSPHKDLGLALL